MPSGFFLTEARAQEAFGRAIFPQGHPNRPHTVSEYEAAAKAATLDDLKAFHAKYYGPAHMTLVVVGECDQPDFHAIAAELAAGIPQARQAVVPGAGHMVPMEAPAEFNALVTEFLKDNAKA